MQNCLNVKLAVHIVTTRL